MLINSGHFDLELKGLVTKLVFQYGLFFAFHNLLTRFFSYRQAKIASRKFRQRDENSQRKRRWYLNNNF